MQQFGEADAELEIEDQEEELTLSQLEKAAEEAPIIKLVNMILIDAHQAGRQRHPHRAVREGLPRPLPHRRRAVRG